MKRVACKMKLKEGCIAEYKKHHDENRPELSTLLSNVEIVNYSIFFDPDTNILFAYHELLETSGLQVLGSTPINQK